MNNSTAPSIREGDTVNTEWSQISYNLWCAQKHIQLRTVPGMRIVNLYEVVDSVIENDLTDTERTAVQLHYFEGLSINRTAQQMSTSYSNTHAALKRAEKKLKHVLKHIIDSEEYKIQTNDF